MSLFCKGGIKLSLKGGTPMIRKAFIVLSAILLVTWVANCGGGGRQLPEQWQIPLVPAKGYKGPAKGMAVINTKTGTDIKVTVSGLEPNRVYTVFFINVKSKMFEGIGPIPHVLAVNAAGEATLQAKMSKNVYLKFVQIGVFLNPGDKPIGNPLGVKATLGELVKKKLPKLILVGKLR
jgi:hypothetical protein